jgi:hypothetical protein
MIAAKPISLTVRPLQVANLCFEVGGILGESFVELGTEVKAFSFADFYMALRGLYPPAPPERPRPAEPPTIYDPSRLRFDSDGIDKVAKPAPPSIALVIDPPDQGSIPSNGLIPGLIPSTEYPYKFGGRALAAMRAETAKATLNKAVNARANAFITKYGGVAAIAEVIRKVMPQRGDYINTLSQLSSDAKQLLDTAYVTDFGEKPLVKSSHTVTDSTSGPNIGNSDTSTGAGAVTKMTSNYSGKDHQTSDTRGLEYRTPNHENLARDARAQIGLGEELISFVKDTHYLKRVEELYQNELASIDADVNQLQIAYLNTILMSPIDGIVTGVYKNVGDPITAGEPVFRIENDAVVLIVARVFCRSPIAIGSKLQIKTKAADPGSAPPVSATVEASIVSARGQGEPDQWEVVAKLSNRNASGKSIFPVGYIFDYDNIEVSIF